MKNDADSSTLSSDAFLTLAELAERWKLDPKTVRRRVTSGDLPAYRLGREYRFLIGDVRAHEHARRVDVTEEAA